MPLELVLLMGLPAAGKSTFAQRFAATHVVIGQDALRGTPHPARRERVVIEQALAAGRSVVVDDTNATPAVRAPLITLARAHGARVVGYHVASTTRASVARNRLREGAARVPNVAIFTVAKRFVAPTPNEGFDELATVRATRNGAFTVEPP